jgi:hypothetical protein
VRPALDPARDPRLALERRLPERVKAWLLPVMAMLTLFLLLALESTPSTPFLYIGF